MPQYELIASRRAGSTIVEMAFALADIPLEVTEIPYMEPGPERTRLLSLNPLGQVPTLIMPDGTVMTESAAMVLHVDEIAPEAGPAAAAA